MKKFTKTLLGAVLSVAMVVTGGLAALGNKPVVTKAAETTVSTSYLAEQVVTSEGATAVIGKRATANTSFSANQHTGLVLTGGTGATFNLGTIDITSSYWNVAEGASKYFALAESAMPFITWNYIVADASVAYELSSLIIRVKDHNDPTNYFEVWTSPYTVGANNPTKMYARASNQAKWGDKRINKGMYTYNSATNYGANQRNRSLAEVSTLFGSVDASLNYGTASTGVWLNGSKVPFALVYDTEEKAVYTNITYNSATNDMKDGFIIRDFSEEDYGDGQALLGDDPWTGFSSNYVDVEVVFETVENAETTSIVIKQFGGKSLNAGEVTVTDSDYVASMPEVVESANKGETITLTAPSISCAFDSTWYQGAYVKILKDGSLVDTVTFDAETKSYTFTTGGNYVLEYYGANDALIGSKNVNVVAVSVPKQLSASEGASFAFNSAFPSNGANNKQPGLILTGGTGSTFNLGTINLANTGWESASYFDAPTAAVPFISYNYMDANVSSIKIRLYDHYDHTKYIDTWVLTAATETRMYAQGSGQTMQGAYRHTQGFKQYPYAVVTKSAIRNTVTPILNANYPGTSGLGLIRYTTGNTTVKPDGTTYAPYGLFFNYEQNALYSSVTYNSTTNNLATSYVIRDFDEPVYEDGIAASGDNLWEKFSTTLVDVEVVLETLVDGAESASVVVRELGGSALSKFLAGGDAYQWTEPLDPTTQ
ncbi:MAG: hypothetical protein J6R88_06270, partial [Clostridia bacterium]|nr:hypothetical protein [Clostridia bacterium]